VETKTAVHDPGEPIESNRSVEKFRKTWSEPTTAEDLQVTDISDSVNSIEVAPDVIRKFIGNELVGTASRELSPEHRRSTGARVTVAFTRQAAISPNCHVRVYYDIAENGGFREMVGIPQLTHTTVHEGRSNGRHHYRLSHWIPALSVMQFIPGRHPPHHERPTDRISVAGGRR